jgi:ABC-type glycerol-3-phosphate transport system permease component
VASIPTTVPAERPRTRARAAVLPSRLLVHAVLILVSLLFLFPFYYMAIQSIMTQRELFSVRPTLFPNQFRYENYLELFALKPFGRIIWNSAFIAVTATVGTMLFSALAGFTFAKYRFPGKDWLFLGLLATMMLPEQITLIPKYLLMVKVLQLQDTAWAVIIPRLASAFGIFYLRQYTAAAVHDELVDAATVDGCGFFGIFRRIALPLMLPGLTVFGMLAFVWTWNDFLWPLLMLQDLSNQTIPVALSNLRDATGTAESYWSLVLAGTTIGTFPLVVLFLTAQKYIVGGLSAGAFKGL